MLHAYKSLFVLKAAMAAIAVLFKLTSVRADNDTLIPLDTSCLKFEMPEQGRLITSDQCTVSLAACGKIRNVEIRAAYRTNAADSMHSRVLSKLSIRPFIIVWPVDSLQRQLYSGAQLSATGTTAGGLKVRAIREGIFISPHRFDRRKLQVPYALGMLDDIKDQAVTMQTADRMLAAKFGHYWNANGLHIRVTVKSSSFERTLPDDIKDRIGALIMLDTATTREPYPTQNHVIIKVPVSKKAVQLYHKPSFFPDGSFEMILDTFEYAHEFKVIPHDFKGFIIDLTIPAHLLGKTPPDSLGCNIVVKAFDSKDSLRTLSWAGGASREIYSPYLWPTLHFAEQPLFSRIWFLWASSFGAGLMLSFMLGLIMRLSRRANSVTRFEQSEGDRKAIDAILLAIDSSLTDQKASLQSIAAELSFTPGKISKLLKRYTGKSFKAYLMNARIEVAKERLRSSHSSEAFIAKSCGFKDVGEMERFFKKNCSISPYAFRKEFHIS
ncbi:MAG: helix-turn-helix domain-containing protein [Chitinivibrionales bacterium]|nr:helix-turn-helix domain-containing protein [Chitinivibrionales bacterium]